MVRGIKLGRNDIGIKLAFHDRRFILGTPAIKNGPISSQTPYGAVRSGAFELSVSDAIQLAKEILETVQKGGNEL